MGSLFRYLGGEHSSAEPPWGFAGAQALTQPPVTFPAVPGKISSDYHKTFFINLFQRISILFFEGVRKRNKGFWGVTIIYWMFLWEINSPFSVSAVPGSHVHLPHPIQAGSV